MEDANTPRDGWVDGWKERGKEGRYEVWMDGQDEATGTSCGTFSQHSPAATRSGWCLANPEPRKSCKRTITPGRGGGGTTQEQPPSAQSSRDISNLLKFSRPC